MEGERENTRPPEKKSEKETQNKKNKVRHPKQEK